MGHHQQNGFGLFFAIGGLRKRKNLDFSIFLKGGQSQTIQVSEQRPSGMQLNGLDRSENFNSYHATFLISTDGSLLVSVDIWFQKMKLCLVFLLLNKEKLENPSSNCKSYLTFLIFNVHY